MSIQPDHELEVLEDDQTVPPRPEELIADAVRKLKDRAMPAPDDPDEGEPLARS